ncbi:hypothetical protein [Caenibius sp. WL]|uniref:hypothetical protein n=1 Tax=Caenibius sp. WL TaxID=2872646 RepID=UPI001C9A0521|nr:hypothetical protein [Caenibius sp. WL]QZP06833.1 hypothetical protein K5X80_08835 [Caenibius sp. WL]
MTEELKFAVRIAIEGCDDRTVIDLEVSASERDFLERLSGLSKEASTYICQPTLGLAHRQAGDVA